MKLVGKNSVLYWLRIPFAIYVAGFILSSLWIILLATYYLFTNNTNSYISKNLIEKYKFDEGQKNELVVELINFKYPFSSMVVQTDNSTLSIIMTIIGLISVSFILWGVLNFINNLVKKNIFTKNTVKTLTVLGLGLIILGIVHIIIEYIDKTHHYGIGTPLLSILIGIIILFIREIFSEGKNIQEENDLTI